jgi:uncharacterized protein YciI
MFIAISRYIADLADVDRCLPQHRAWVAEGYASGMFLVSGRRNPPIGGVIVAYAQDEASMRGVLAQDPFTRGGLADYEVHAFNETGFPYRSEGFDKFMTTVTERSQT